ncbi:MAG: hypothetical protein KDD44_05515 [Bdellovibrionales bacterium]|nr:hypothetical protein [Bdellovibrionales bacterium]
MIQMMLGAPNGNPFWKFYVVLGALLVLFGVLIIAMPELLVVLVASGIMFVGISLIGIGLSLRRFEKMTKGSTVVHWD